MAYRTRRDGPDAGQHRGADPADGPVVALAAGHVRGLHGFVVYATVRAFMGRDYYA